MSYTTKIMMISVMMLLATITVGGVYASTVTVTGGQISQAGDEISVPIILDIADNGLMAYQMRIIVTDPTVAEVTRVTFPSWAGFNNVVTTLPATTVEATVIDMQTNPNNFHNKAGQTNIPIATVTLKGLKAGSTPINLNFVGQDLGGGWVYPTIQAGTLQVNGVVPTTVVTTQATTAVPTTTTAVPTTTTVPPTTVVTTQATTAVPTTTTAVPTTTTVPPTTVVTTQATTAVPTTTTAVPTTTTVAPTTVVTTQATTAVPTTPTPVPTMPVPTGPTGQVYFSTTPQGAAIYIDGSLSNAVTPATMAVPVGTHQAVFKLAGYNDLQAGFEAQTNAMTTVSRRLYPGSSVIQVTPGTTGVPVVTTVPTTTVTQITVVPTTVPGTRPIWPFRITWPSWVRHYLPTW